MPRFLLFVVIVFFLTAACFGQSQSQQQTGNAEPEHEVLVWSRNTTIFPWYFYTGKVVLDTRYNLDQDKTGTICLGKSFGGDAFSVIPEACGYIGKFNGYGPEIWILSDTKKYSVTSYLQYAKFLDTESFGYGWIQAGRKVGKHFELGFGSQALKNGVNPFEADFGPAVNFKFGKVILTFIHLWRTTPEEKGKRTIFVGMGYVF